MPDAKGLLWVKQEWWTHTRVGDTFESLEDATLYDDDYPGEGYLIVHTMILIDEAGYLSVHSSIIKRD